MTPELAERIVRDALATDPNFGVSFEEVRQAVEQGFAVPFATENSIVLVRLYDCDEGRHAVSWAGGGDLKECAGPIRERVETFAHNNGCKSIDVRSRPGVVRVLRKHGYEINARDASTVTMRKWFA